MKNTDRANPSLLDRLKEVLLGAKPHDSSLPGEDDRTAQSEQVLHFVRRVEEGD